MEPPRRLSDFPWVTVNVECKLCPRRGRYRLARLAARLGPETELERVLELLATDCQWLRPGTKPRKYEERCGIRFRDLDRTHTPPDEPPASPAMLRVVEGGRLRSHDVVNDAASLTFDRSSLLRSPSDRG